MSRSSSSTSVARQSGPLSEQRRAEIFGRSRKSPVSELTKDQSHSANQSFESSGSPSSPRRRGGPPPLDLSPSSYSQAYSPEANGTAKPKFPPVAYNNKVRELPHRPRSSSSRRQITESIKTSVQVDDDPEQKQRGRRKSQGEVLDEKIDEVEEKIAHIRVSPPKRQSIDIASNTTTTPLRENVRQYTPDSYGDRLPGTRASPLVANTQAGRLMTRSMDLETAMEMVNGNSLLKNGSYEHEYEEEERMKNGERSGGSGGSRPRKALPTDFRNGSFVSTPRIYETSIANWRHYKVYSECAENRFIATLQRSCTLNAVPSPSNDRFTCALPFPITPLVPLLNHIPFGP